MAIITTTHPAWATALTPNDMLILGIEPCNPSVVLGAFEQLDGVDLGSVTRCLELLKANAAVLHCGVPRALMVFCPATGCYSVSFDGDLDEDLAHLTEAQAGLWLAMLSSEQGALPETTDHWYVINVDGRILSGLDLTAIATYLALADHLDVEVQPHRALEMVPTTEAYDRVISRAFWALAARCQEGR